MRIRKSSLVRFPLVLKQTMEEYYVSPLKFNGETIDYGNFSDVVFNHDENREISFGLSFDTKLVWHIYKTFSRLPRFIDNPASFIKNIFMENEFFKMDVIMEQISQNKLHKLKITDYNLSTNKTCGAFFNTKLINENFIGDMKSLENENNYRISLPLFSRVFELPTMLFNGFFPSNLFTRDYGLSGDFGEDWQEVILIFVAIEIYCRTVLKNISYLGPFRSKPSRDYRVNEGEYANVGKDGQYAPQVLWNYYWESSDSLLNVNNWLEESMGLNLSIKELEDSKFKIMIKDLRTGIENNLADVGFGISQIMPIITQTLLPNPLETDVENIQIIEQPELHLHPAAQCGLADLFIQGVSNNPQVRYLIETHSEHLILRLRKRLAEGKVSP